MKLFISLSEAEGIAILGLIYGTCHEAAKLSSELGQDGAVDVCVRVCVCVSAGVREGVRHVCEWWLLICYDDFCYCYTFNIAFITINTDFHRILVITELSSDD